MQPATRRRRGRASAANEAPAETKTRGRRGRAGAALAPAPEADPTVEPPKRGRRGRFVIFYYYSPYK